MKKYLKPLFALALVCALTVGATLAYLTDTTEEVTNTFTVGAGVDIALAEQLAATNYSTGFELVPGTEYAKDPTITVDDTSDDCYLFVEVIESITITKTYYETLGTVDAATVSDVFNNYVGYAVDSAWDLVKTSEPVATPNDESDPTEYTLTVTNTYVYGTNDAAAVCSANDEKIILAAETAVADPDREDSKGYSTEYGFVTIPSSLDGITAGYLSTTSEPTLSFVAYAIQSDNISASEAVTTYSSAFNK